MCPAEKKKSKRAKQDKKDKGKGFVYNQIFYSISSHVLYRRSYAYLFILPYVHPP
ncbi:hypothetical protein IscW_ISCW003238 [Ixodes scapularis]|uniref:Uncharacterized protein n=1 Tax=Ixodes scapularis TaxID=6945 RepID=B7PBM6_IXOSC|nr:hypothetical protein IscW_ISCW003238 [Ixodes scapularis]|eukprot:XP_002408566.1 hypothetical protein IscW_ISCW003238 [Ixodes scapularis]